MSSVSIEKGLSRREGLTFLRGSGTGGADASEDEIGDFILLEDENSVFLEDVGSSLVLESDVLPELLTEAGDPFITENTLETLGTEYGN